MKKLGLIVFAVWGLTCTSQANFSKNRNEDLKISTFNIKWFGLGGSMWNDPDQEFRERNIRRFVVQELNDSQIIVFTEVVNTKLLEDTLQGLYKCVSYDGAWDRHQHIVTCFKGNKYRAEKYDSDFIIDEVDLGSGGLRPATQVKICHRQGKCFLQVVGVHLAAGKKTEKRIEQVNLLAAELKKQSRLLPTIVTGDFNSYVTEQNGLNKDDIEIFEETLSHKKQRFRSVTKDITTYNSGEWARAYDHIITTNEIKVFSTKGYEACKPQPNYKKKFIPYQSFRKHFSDHCPVTAEIRVPKA